MSLATFLASIYFLITVVLWFKRDYFGKSFILHGSLSLLFVLTYPMIVLVPASVQYLMMFIVFSLMIFNFGITFWTLMKLLKRSDRNSTIVAIMASISLILFLFKIKVCIGYLYIPVLLYKICDLLNKQVNVNCKKNIKK
ncbi:hypothetical protein ACER0A_008705 [Haloimpatiens sp. FM7315]|uniref:hypothetical protein n=1 Tax=Haloimpatiens sp. FM7315 TaxID=3298609 RepID=UPI00370CF44E